MLSSIKSGIANKEREVTDERPYSKWLYNYVDKMLDGDSYIVESQEENLSKVLETYESEEVNEYLTSQADLVIQKVQTNPILQCCTVAIHEEDCRNKCVSELVAELKLSDSTSSPMWECFHNMLAVGANMAMKKLIQGIILSKIMVYGLVVVVNNLKHTRFLKLEMDLDNGSCYFKECEQCFPLDLILNTVVSQL